MDIDEQLRKVNVMTFARKATNYFYLHVSFVLEDRMDDVTSMMDILIISSPCMTLNTS